MKKSILLAVFLLAIVSLNAQMKVYSNGKIAFGSTSTTPNYIIDVIAGDVNVIGTNGYRLGGNYVLWQNNVTSNIFVGNGAGSGSVTGGFNTAIGNLAGSALTSGTYNTLLGYNAGATASLVNATAIGSGASVTTNSTMILGDNTVGVGIGYSGSALTSQTKFDVLYGTGTAFTAGPVYGGHFINTNTVSGSTNPYVYGLYTAASGSESSIQTYHYGIAASATNASNCVGISAVGTGKADGNRVYGGYFNASAAGVAGSSGINYGVYSTVAASGNFNYAIYATVSSYAAGNYAGYFNGDVYVNGGSHSGTGYLATSDRQFKTKIDTIGNIAAILRKLKPKKYFFDTLANNGMHFSGKKQYGFIAQELQEVMPELVYNVVKPADYDNQGKVIHESIPHLAINYDAFIPLLTSAIQIQQGTIDSIRSANKVLQAQINDIVNNCCTKSGSTAVNPTTSGTITAQLFQNVPNPFNQTTAIKCFIPESSKTASLLIFDMNGTLKRTLPINEKGTVNLTINGKELIAGMYFYSLIIDAQEIDTKKMILTEQ